MTPDGGKIVSDFVRSMAGVRVPAAAATDALRFALDSVRTEIPDDGEVEVVSLLGAVALGLTKALSARERGE
jgi:hypothetical protein